QARPARAGESWARRKPSRQSTAWASRLPAVAHRMRDRPALRPAMGTHPMRRHGTAAAQSRMRCAPTGEGAPCRIGGMDLGLPLHSVEQVRAIDREAIEAHGVSAFELMGRAAAAALAQLRQRWPGARRVLVACGNGNNGGDGFVLARLAQEAGLHAQVLQAEAGEGTTPEARRARAEWLAETGALSVFHGDLPDADV